MALAAAIELRASDPLLAIAIGSCVAAAAGLGWLALARHTPLAALRRATALFAILFSVQAAIYLFHESAEAGFLPGSEVLHAATEPYGPDGIYGRFFSVALFLLPVATALTTRVKTWGYSGVVAAAVIVVAAIEFASFTNGQRAARSTAPAAPPAEMVARIAAAPHLLFRHTAVDRDYGRMSVAPLGTEDPSTRAAAAFNCERVSFAGGHGICLFTDRGVFTSYKAVLFDASMTASKTITLAGSPTRTRVSADGRVGAVTVFAAGGEHTYTGSSFSTRTTILDLTTGDEIGDLESFTTWRNGTRIKAADFNFWGVTFARDHNTFYATLKTAGVTYLVQGDLGLRKLTVLRDNVECPALSPDNRSLGFKKRVATGAEPWRFYVLDLGSMTERPIAGETRSIDDQLEWLDDAHVLYGVPRTAQSSSFDLWMAAINGTTPARIYLRDAESPVVVR